MSGKKKFLLIAGIVVVVGGLATVALMNDSNSSRFRTMVFSTTESKGPDFQITFARGENATGDGATRGDRHPARISRLTLRNSMQNFANAPDSSAFSAARAARGPRSGNGAWPW